ncbi:MAG: glutamine--fructose-6-phosphate transaminase (isomerizing), partial [Candidatus Hermodarchaeota archaeon]
MCGIFGIITNQNLSIGKVALEGIKRLEYRGYDSCGIVVQLDSKLLVKKDAGKIDEIHKKLRLDEFPSGAKLALAHTRWATHGPPTKINAHPHLDCSSKIAVIHNGILENFIELKAELKSKGHIFKSDTDTEVISHLVEEYMKSQIDFKTAVAKSVNRCEGAYAVAICHAEYPDYFIVVRKESPLVIGIEEGITSYCASDIPAFLPYTRSCYIMDEDEMAVLKAGSVEFYDLNNSKIVKEKELQKIEWSIDAAEKGGYDHFMLKEIHEEPIALRKTLRIPEEKLEDFARVIWGAKHLYITAAGTSFYASLAGKFIITKFLGKYIQAIECSEFQTQLGDALQEDSVIIAVSQSGETVDLIEAIRWAKDKLLNKIKIISITNVVGSSLTRYSDHVIVTQAGPEIGVAATKTYCTQVLTLSLIALKIAYLRKLLPEEELKSYYSALSKTPDIIESLISKSSDLIKSIVVNLEKSHNFFFLARGIS